MDKLRLTLKYLKGLIILGGIAFVKGVTDATYNEFLYKDLGPRLMVSIRKIAYGIRDFFKNSLSGGRVRTVYTSSVAA